MSFRRKLVGQFKQPHGLWGGVAGKIMAWRGSNRQRNRWTVDLLDIAPSDEVLEIGYGPGLAAGWVAKKLETGHLFGIDHSEPMFRQASKRNRYWIKKGRMALHCGDVFDLPQETGPFDKIYSANVAQFWENPNQTFAMLRDHMKPGGTIATTFMPRNIFTATEASPSRAGAEEFADKVAETMRLAGFSEIRLEWLDLEPVPAVCILAKS